MKVDAEYKAEVFSGREGEAVVNPILLHMYVYKNGNEKYTVTY